MNENQNYSATTTSWKTLLVGLGGWVMAVLILSVVGSWMYFSGDSSPVSLQLGPSPTPTPLPLLPYRLSVLDQYPVQTSTITITETLNSPTKDTNRFLFEYQSAGNTISGLITAPKIITSTTPVIIMARGYVPPESYQPGGGTNNSSIQFAKAGFITLAPDFLGFGSSDDELEDSWAGRFIKPINIMELHLSLLENGLPKPLSHKPINTQIGYWGHSNGGQVMLATKLGFKTNTPTSLWAPVTAPFPYSILFFSDEHPDEGKATRNWLGQFEKDYDVFDFSITQNLDRLTGRIQIHHGTADEAALYAWTEEFLDKIEVELNQREESREFLATASATATSSANLELPNKPLYDPQIDFFTYPGANHNLTPGWDAAVQRDIQFFETYLK